MMYVLKPPFLLTPVCVSPLGVERLNLVGWVGGSVFGRFCVPLVPDCLRRSSLRCSEVPAALLQSLAESWVALLPKWGFADGRETVPWVVMWRWPRCVRRRAHDLPQPRCLPNNDVVVSPRLLLPLQCQTPKKVLAHDPSTPRKTHTLQRLHLLPEVRADTKTGRPYPSAADGGTTRLYDDAIKTMTSRSEALVKKYTDVPPQQRKQISASASGERMSTRESTSRDAKHKCRVDKCMESSTKVGCFRCTWEDEMEIVERLHTKSVEHGKDTMEKLWKRYEVVGNIER